MATEDAPPMWIANLHDAYMTANLMRTLMLREPIEQDAESFMVSPRGRLERAWYRDLYVTVEAWLAGTEGQQSAVRKAARDEVAQLESLIEQGRSNGSLDRLRDVRDYMCHRDRREYWDKGRSAVAGEGMLGWATELDSAFEQTTLAALRSVH